MLVAHGAAYDGPPALNLHTAVTQWAPDPVLIIGLVVVAAVYLYGVRRLTARGDAWSPWRSIAFIVGGLGTIALATLSFLGAYDDTLFSVHMAQHMVLQMVAPVFLALGAPVTLALRTLPLRPRRWLMWLLHSWLGRLFSFPVVGWVLFVASPFALYFSGLYPLSLRNDLVHELLHVHFVLVGCVFFWPLLGIDPLPNRMPYPGRLLLVFTVLPYHAFLGIALMSRTTVIADSWYAALHRPWGASALSDQHTGGGILWASGDLVGLLFLAALFFQWVRAEEREAVREDRRLDRLEAQEARRRARVDEDAELAAYNARLAALAAEDRPGG